MRDPAAGLFPRSRLARLCCRARILAVAPRRLPAQSPDERAELERFRDSLAATADSIGLLALERRMIDRPRRTATTRMHPPQAGLPLAPARRPGGQAHYDDAASEFQWAIDLQPTWPYAWYGMGLAEYGVGDSQVSFVTGLKTMLGKDALTRSAVAFAKSAEVDPRSSAGWWSWRTPRCGSGSTSSSAWRSTRSGAAARRLRRSDPQVLLARGRVEREVGDGDSALAAFSGYLRAAARPGPRPARGRAHAVPARPLRRRAARTTRARPPTTPATVAGYRGDLATIASDSVLAEFDSTAGRAARRLARQFWTERDRAELRADGERLREHYRRLFYARKNFQLTALNRHYDIVERYRSGSRDFDDRGIIYIRHGEPQQPGHLRRARARAQRVVALQPSRRRPDLPFHRARGRAGLQAGREPVRRARLQQRRALRGGLGAADNPVAEQLMLSREQLVADLPAAAGRRARQHRPVPDRGAAGGAGEHRASGPPATATSSLSR